MNVWLLAGRGMLLCGARVGLYTYVLVGIATFESVFVLQLELELELEHKLYFVSSSSNTYIIVSCVCIGFDGAGSV